MCERVHICAVLIFLIMRVYVLVCEGILKDGNHELR